MLFRKLRQIFGISFLLSSALCAAAQTENLSAQLINKQNDAEIQQFLDSRSDAELKEVCDSLVKQDESANFIKDFSARVRAMRLAQTTAQKIHYNSGESTALFRLGSIYLKEKQSAPAIDFFEQSLSISERTGDFQTKALRLESISYTYRNQGSYDKALEYGNRAVESYEKLSDPRLANALDGLGAIYMYRGEYNQAEAAHRRALAINEKRGVPEDIANSLFHLGIINRLRGNYGDALRLYQEARDISDKLATKNPNLYPSATFLRHIGGTYFLQGNLRLALDYGKQSLALDEKRGDKLGIAYGLQFIAIIRVAEKNYAEALKLAVPSGEMFETTGDGDGLARSVALLGNIYLSIGEYDRSLGYFRRALALREASGSRDGMAVARIGMARVFLTQGKFADALELAKKAADSAQENGNRELLWQAQSVAGETYLAQNKCDETRRAFDAAISTIESLRGEIVGGASENSLFFAERVKPYQQLAAMLAAQNDFAESFEYAERAKARVLLDAVRFGRNHQTANMTADEKTQENILRGSITSLNAQISKNGTSESGKLADLKTKLESARTDLARFQTNLYAVHPELRIKRGAVNPIKAGEIGSLLNEKSALLEYLVSDDAVLLFVFTKTKSQTEFKTYRIPVSRDELDKRVERFREMLAGRNVLFAAESRALYETLLRPAAQQIAGKTNLTIVPDDGLWELPFQALQSAANHYVLDDASLSYSPSLTILREQRSHSRETVSDSQNVLAFANPMSGSPKADTNFAALPEAEKQTNALKNLYGTNNVHIYNRRKADESVFKRETAKVFSVLHLATHGVLDNNSPLNSYVLLAPDQESNDDGKLEAWEILEMNLKSDLVMLSACETARGQSRSGEGLIGLSWSLMVAGARNVVVSQWKVESGSTTDLTINFYKSLKQNAARKPEALQQAALKLRRDPATAHPFYWAGFVLIGEAD